MAGEHVMIASSVLSWKKKTMETEDVWQDSVWGRGGTMRS